MEYLTGKDKMFNTKGWEEGSGSIYILVRVLHYTCTGILLFEADCGKLKMNFINSRTTS